MQSFMIENGLYIVTITFVMASIMVALMAFFMRTYLRDRSKSEYDFDRNRAILSEMRYSYERQISMLSMQMTATEERWRDANHLLLSAQEAQPTTNHRKEKVAGNFLRSFGVLDEDFEADQNLVFVLTPFQKSEESTYRTIQKACADLHLNCARSDDHFAQGDILAHIVKTMVRSRLIIANIGSRNPNVFYELGIAQALDKQTILVSKTIDSETPFDVRSRRIIAFSNPYDLERSLRDAIVDITNNSI